MEDTSVYVFKILKNVYPEDTFTEDAFEFMNIFLEGVLYKLLELYRAGLFLQDGVKRIFGDELSKNALSKAYKATIRFYFCLEKNEEFKTRSNYSDLVLHTFVVEKSLKNLGYELFSDYFVVFLTAILEFLIEEIVEQSVITVTYDERLIIHPDDIINGINENEELYSMTTKLFSKNKENWTNYFANYKDHPITNTKKEGLLKYTMNEITIIKANKIQTISAKIRLTDEYIHNNSEFIQNETTQLENDKIEFESEYLPDKEELEKEESETQNKEIQPQLFKFLNF